MFSFFFLAYYQIFAHLWRVDGEGPQNTRLIGALHQIGCPGRVHNGTPLKTHSNVRVEMLLKGNMCIFIFGFGLHLAFAAP